MPSFDRAPSEHREPHSALKSEKRAIFCSQFAKLFCLFLEEYASLHPLGTSVYTLNDNYSDTILSCNFNVEVHFILYFSIQSARQEHQPRARASFKHQPQLKTRAPE